MCDIRKVGDGGGGAVGVMVVMVEGGGGGGGVGDKEGQHDHSYSVWSDVTTTCRTLLLHINNNVNSTYNALRYKV